MGFLEKIKTGEFTGLQRALGRGKHSNRAGVDDGAGEPVVQQSGGIMGGPQRKQRGGGGTKFWQDDDGSGPLTLGLRGAQTFFPFVNLWIYVAIALFQKKWGVGPSGLTGLALFVNIEALMHGAIFLATPLLYDRVSFVRGVSRFIQVNRTAFLLNAIQAGIQLIMGIATTVSAYSGGCKSAASDPNAALEGYTDAMGGFCRNKKAGAAFFWFNALAWIAALVLVLLTWQRTRNNPTSGGFAIPGSQFPLDDDEAFSRPSIDNPTNHHAEEAQYRASGDYYGDRPLFGGGQGYDAPQGYGGEEDQEASYDAPSPSYHPPHGTVSAQAPPRVELNYDREAREAFHPQATDPFADVGSPVAAGAPSYSSHDDGSGDPYAAIRMSMDVRRPSY